MDIFQFFLLAGGIYHVFFFFFHAMFWRFDFLNWQEELPRMSKTNRAVIQMLAVAVCVFLLITAYLSLRYPQELLTTDLGRDLLVGIALFWFARLIGEFSFKAHSDSSPAIIIVCVLGMVLYLLPASNLLFQ